MTFFSRDYADARVRFREALSRAGGTLTAIPIDATGPSGEALTIDIGWLGAESPTDIIVHSCGIHGVEGFAGSAIQLQWLAAGPPALPDRAAVVLVHVANPYGMAWLRRVNEHNVDLNRNCLRGGDRYAGAPEGYLALDSFLNPPRPSALDTFYARAALLIARYGMSTLKQTIAGGQYENDRGLFFGGRALEPEPRAIRNFIDERMGSAVRLVGIDVHTGLGPFAVDTLLVDAAAEPAAVDRAREVFGARVKPLDPAEGPAYRVKGTFETLFRESLPKADLLLVGHEHGTYSSVRVLRALRTENAWHRAGTIGVEHPARAALREMFAPADPLWRERVLEHGRAVIDRALASIGADVLFK